MIVWGRGALHVPGEDDGEVLMTPLVDIFAVLVIFLTFGVATTGAPWLRPLSDITLPRAQGGAAAPAAIKVSLSRTSIRVENQLVASMEAGQIRVADMDGTHVIPVYQALQRERTAQLMNTQTQASVVAIAAQMPSLHVEAARGLPYQVIERILRTGAAAGFTTFRLAVTHPGG